MKAGNDRRSPDIQMVGLLTTLNGTANRVSMHGVRESFLEAQARAYRLPLLKVPLPGPCTDQWIRADRSGARFPEDELSTT
jgi:hypothetical protein